MIVYGSKYGSVKTFAEAVAARGPSPATAMHDARNGRACRSALEALPAGEPVVVLGPIYAGRLYGPVGKFLERHESMLRERPLALGLGCLYTGEKAEEQLAAAWPAWAVGHAAINRTIGGRVILKELPGPIRFLMTNMIRLTEDVDTMQLDVAGEYANFLGASGT